MKPSLCTITTTLGFALSACASTGAPRVTAPPPASAATNQALPVSPERTVAPADAGEASPVRTYLRLRAPMFSEHFETTPVADVEGELVTVRDLTNALAGASIDHSQSTPSGSEPYEVVLDRLINTRLMLVEAKAMGLDEDPLLQTALREHEENTLRAMAERAATEGVEADPEEVEALYEQATRHWKLRALTFEDEADARAFQAAVSDGADFDEAAEPWIAEGKAERGTYDDPVPASEMLLPVRAAVEPTAPGQVTAPIALRDAFAVVLVVEVTHPADERKREEATQRSLERQRYKALRSYFDALVDKHATIKQRALARLDFAARRPGFEALAKSQRVLAKIEGEAPITVADVAAEIRSNHHHGVDAVIRDKSINGEKLPALEKILARRLLLKQALLDGHRDSQEFRNRMRDRRIELVVGLFLRKVVMPDVVVTEGDMKDYYQEHLDDFQLPAFVRLSSLGFQSREAADEALERLRDGASWQSVVDDGSEQLAEAERTLAANGRLVTEGSLDADLAVVLDGVPQDGYALYPKPDGACYLVQVTQRVAAQPKAYVEVREQISKTVLAEKLDAALDQWAAKLREGYTVRTYLDEVSSAPREPTPRPAPDAAAITSTTAPDSL